MWLFDTLSTLFYNAYLWVWDIAGIASEIWVVGGRISPVFYDFAWELYNISWRFKELSYWADGLETQIRDLLTWDSIREEIEARFPIVTWSPLDIVDNIWDTLQEKIKAWLEDQVDWWFELTRKILIKLL